MYQFSSVPFSHSVVSDSLWPYESQHARPPCLSPTPGVHPDSCALSRRCHPAISRLTQFDVILVTSRVSLGHYTYFNRRLTEEHCFDGFLFLITINVLVNIFHTVVCICPGYLLLHNIPPQFRGLKLPFNYITIGLVRWVGFSWVILLLDSSCSRQSADGSAGAG